MIVVIPMAGAGSRFAGYTFPKPLITIRNKPMIQWVVESLDMPWAYYRFVVDRATAEAYPIAEMCQQLTPYAQVVIQDEPRQGAAHSVLLGLEGMAPTEALLIANADQWLEWDSNHFLRAAFQPDIDGAIPLFSSVHPKWSYAKVEKGWVTEVAEKRPISRYATCGLYYWKSVFAFETAARMMMQEERKRVNGEWYVAPVYNEVLKQGAKVLPYDKLTMWGLGTPEDLEEFKLHVCTH